MKHTISLKVDKHQFFGMVYFCGEYSVAHKATRRDVAACCIREFSRKITEARLDCWWGKNPQKQYSYKLPYSVAASLFEQMSTDVLTHDQQGFFGILHERLLSSGHFVEQHIDISPCDGGNGLHPKTM